MRRYIDEYYELPEKRWLGLSPGSIKELVLQQYKLGKTVAEIVRYLQSELYIFTDEEETKWETEIVENIINNKPVINRWTNEKFY